MPKIKPSADAPLAAGGEVSPAVSGGPPSAGAIEAYPDDVYDAHVADNSETEHRRLMRAKAVARKV